MALVPRTIMHTARVEIRRNTPAPTQLPMTTRNRSESPKAGIMAACRE